MVPILLIIFLIFSRDISSDQINLKGGKKIKNVKTYLEGNRIKIIDSDNKASYILKSEVDSIEPGTVIVSSSSTENKVILKNKNEIKPDMSKQKANEKDINNDVTIENEKDISNVVIKENENEISNDGTNENKKASDGNQSENKMENENKNNKNQTLDAKNSRDYSNFQPYYSLLPFYSSYLTRDEKLQGYSFITSKLFFLSLYMGYRPTPKNYVGLGETIFIANSVNQFSQGTMRTGESLVRLGIYNRLQEDTIDPFTKEVISQDQYIRRRRLSLNFFIILTLLDVFLNIEAKKMLKAESSYYNISTYATRDIVSNQEEMGIRFDYYLF